MAAKEMVWNFQVQGIPYKIELKKNQVSVNGAEPVKLNKLTRKSNFIETNHFIMIEGKEAVLHIRQFDIDLLRQPSVFSWGLPEFFLKSPYKIRMVMKPNFF